MEKKVYKAPAIKNFQMTSVDGLLQSVSASVEGMKYRGDTKSGDVTNVTDADTKSQGQWDDFWNNLVQ